MKRRFLFLVASLILIHTYMWGEQSLPLTISINKTVVLGEKITLDPATDAVKGYGAYPWTPYTEWWEDDIKNKQDVFSVEHRTETYDWRVTVCGVTYSGENYKKNIYTLTPIKSGVHTFMTKVSYSYPHEENRDGNRTLVDESGYIDIIYIINVSTGVPDIEINATNFPDENFRNWVLSQTYGADGVLTEAEIADVKEINVYNKSISNLKGIEFFTALNTLDCVSNQLTTLDVSNNTQLKNLKCYYNQLTTLDVSKNIQLNNLECYYNQLITLNVPKNATLATLSCSNNKLTSLDVSSNTELMRLTCHNNQLIALDVSKNKSLSWLICDNNQLTALDISNNARLTRLDCNKNLLSALDFTNNTKLKYLECYQNKIGETAMGNILSSLPTVTSGEFYVIDTTKPDEENVCTAIQVAVAKGKGWTVYDNHGGNAVEYAGSSEEEIITFADANVKAICVANWDTNGDGELSKAEAAAVTDLGTVFKGNKEIISFNELQYFTGLTSIGDNAFNLCDCLTSVTIPHSVTSIGDNAFFYCIALTSIVVENGNTVYDSRNNCNAIIKTSTNTLIVGCKNTIIPNSVTSIDNEAFQYCIGMASITIPNSVTSIGDNAFYGCTGLTSINIPNSVTSIGSSAFSNCSSLTSIVVGSGNTVYDSRNNCNAIIKTSTNTLIVGCKNTIIPNSVTSIGSSAFSGCSGLTSVTIPNSVTSIGRSAFSGCSGLTSVTIPNSVTSIGYGVFEDCRGLTSITIPNSVTSIGIYAFQYCSALTSVTIPNSVTSIGSHAFYYCSALTSIISEIQDPFIIDVTVFSGTSENAVLMVPAGTKSKYEATNFWNKFTNIKEYELGITINETNFPDENFRNWILTQPYGTDSLLTDAEVAGVDEINVSKMSIKNMKGIEYFTDLEYLNCSYNELTDLDLSNNLALLSIDGSVNHLNYLDVSKNTQLKWLRCDNNQLTSLDVSENTALYGLYCSTNQLTVLDVSQNTELLELQCDRNELTSLDVSKNPHLYTSLSCVGNKLTILDVTNNPKLTRLFCGSNSLSSIDVSNNSDMEIFSCPMNQLTTLDISKNVALKHLYCNSNKLAMLDVSNANKLEALLCDKNQLTSLNLSNNTALTRLDCYQNKIGKTAMGNLVASLPTVTKGTLNVIDTTNDNEENVCTSAQVTIAKEKGWIVYDYHDGKREEYTGEMSIDLDPIEGETTVNTENLEGEDLSDNVVGDVYYNVGDDGYDSTDGSIVISEPTNMGQIEDKEPGSEDVRENFTGMILRVSAGKGTIIVRAKTAGNAHLVVQVGNGTPMIAKRTEECDVVVSYDVTEDTYVYIYAILGSSAARSAGSASEDEVRIYIIKVLPDVSAVTNIEYNTVTTGCYYMLDGRRVEGTPIKKGVYIVNGHKVVRR